MKTVYAKDYGIFPNGQSTSAALRRMIEEHPTDTRFVLEKGRYDFWNSDGRERALCLSNTDDINPRKVSLLFDGVKNVILDGAGCEFVCHGQLLPIAVLGSENVTLQNFSIDWEIPLSAEMTVVGVGDGYADLEIDSKLYPYQIKQEQITFCGENWESQGNWIIEFDAVTKKAAFGTADAVITHAKQLQGDVVRCYGDFQPALTVGNYGEIRHNKRINSSIFMEDSVELHLQNIVVHNCGGLGILAQFCTDLSFYRVDFRPNTARGRKMMSGHDDGIHLSNDRGSVTVEECYFYGLMDDPINLHGTSVKVEEAVNTHTLRCAFGNDQSQGFTLWARKGDEIAVLDPQTLNPILKLTAREYRLQDTGTFELSFEEELVLGAKTGYVLENLSATASFTCRNNFFGSCRARGILVSTPKPVLIENNHFQSAGSAILLAGDGVYWYESGACHEVTIRGNVFDSCCNTCGYQYCEGVISIMPEVPHPSNDAPFHSNINICGNCFASRNTTLLYAFSAQNLSFCDNTIERSYEYGVAPHEKTTALLRFVSCKTVKTQGNRLLGDLIALSDYEDCIL